MKKETTKRILIAILIVTLFNFISPTATHADVEDLFTPFMDLLVGLGDLVIEGLQEFFIGEEKIQINEVGERDNYLIRYSPGIIFSDRVAHLDINFFNPGTYSYEKIEYIEVNKKEIEKSRGSCNEEDVAKSITDKELNDALSSIASNYGYSEKQKDRIWKHGSDYYTYKVFGKFVWSWNPVDQRQ